MKKTFKGIILVLFCGILYAKPVKVEEILSYKNQWQLDLGISYTNIEKSAGESQLILIPIGNNQAIPVYNYVGQQKVNQDYFIYSLNLRYGLTDKLEVYSYISFF